MVANRAKARVLPVVVRDGIIWLWAASLLDSTAEPNMQKLEALLVEPIGKPGVLHTDYFRDLWMDATVLCGALSKRPWRFQPVWTFDLC